MEFEAEYGNSYFYKVVDIVENYGWYILIGAIVIGFIIHLFKFKISSYLEWRNEQDYMAKYHKNPDLFAQRQEAQRLRTLQLQNKYEEDAEKYQQKLLEIEEKRLEERRKKLENAHVGHTLGSTQNKSTKSLKNDYTPLMGDSSRSYRPTRKSPCSGGGCGR